MNGIYQGAITFEEPYTVCAEGVKFKNEIALKIDGDLSRKSCCEITKALNLAYQIGFSNGSQLLNNPINLKK